MCAKLRENIANLPHEGPVHTQPDTGDRKIMALELFAELPESDQREIIALASALASQQ